MNMKIKTLEFANTRIEKLKIISIVFSLNLLNLVCKIHGDQALFGCIIIYIEKLEGRVL